MERHDDEMEPVMSEGEGDYNDDIDDMDNSDEQGSSFKESQEQNGDVERAMQQAILRQAEQMQSLMGLSNLAGFQNFPQFSTGFGSSLGMLQAQIQALSAGQNRNPSENHSGIATPATSPFVSNRNNISPKLKSKDRPKEGSDSLSPQRLSSSSNSSFPAFPGLTSAPPHPPLTPSPSSESPPQQEATSRATNQQSWTFEEQFKQLYELSDEVGRKLFLDDLFDFMQKRGTPITRLPIMAKQVLDLYELYNLVVARGGLVDVINKKLWQEIIKGLHLPSSITSAAFTLRTQYMKYLYPYECEKEKFSSASELQAAIDGNRREGRRSSYGPYGDVAPRGTASLSALASHLSPMGLVHRNAVNGNAVTSGSSSPPTGSTQDALAALDMSQRLHIWNLYNSLGDMGGDMAAAMAAASRFLPPQTEALNLAAEQQAAAAAAAAAAARAPETPKQAAKERRAKRDEERNVLRIKEESQIMEEPSIKKLLLDEDANSDVNDTPATGNPGANIKISSRGGEGRSGDNSLVVSMEINGIVYQGVLFAQAAAEDNLGSNAAMRSRVA